MGASQRRKLALNVCIYCGSNRSLSDEHVIPYGLGGEIKLKKASCGECSDITKRFEQRLLRGHWRAYRNQLRMQSRSANYPVNCKVILHREGHPDCEALLPTLEQSVLMLMEFDPPLILSGRTSTELPHAPRILAQRIGQATQSLLVEGQNYIMKPNDRITIPVDFSVDDFIRLLAKMAHGFAIHRRGLKACSEYFLPTIVRGDIKGALTYVGGTTLSVLQGRLPGSGIHAFNDRVNGKFLSVDIQLFREKNQTPPIYEVVVGVR